MRIAPSLRDMFRPQGMHRLRTSGLSRREGGFSLVELIIVLALVAAMALIAVPWFVKISQRQQIQSAAREIAVALTAARMTAVKRNTQISFVVSSSGTAPLEFQTVEPNPPAPTPTPVPRTLRLPARAARFKGPTPSAIIFGGDGRIAVSTGQSFVIEGPVGMATPNPITINVNGSGRVEVVTPTSWQ
jgi:prepilin-type N-terminal cleavage/methylation domain-containing protein